MLKAAIKLILKILLVAIPLWLLIAVYYIFDPFKVIYDYSSYYKDNVREVPVNREYATTEIFLKNKASINYDSFIFGSSRSLAFRCTEWKKYIKGIPFHYDASGESIFGISGKLKFLDSKKINIKNCLIIADSATLMVTANSKGYSYIKHPLISGENKLSFQYEFLTTFLSNKFFIPYLASLFKISIPDFFEYPDIIDKKTFEYDKLTNDIIFGGADNDLSKNPPLYYYLKKDLFSRRDTSAREFVQPLITDKQIIILTEMKTIFDKYNTDYKIVINPAYDQRYLNTADVKELKLIFGETKVFDYSGINEITNNISNYYEPEHCRPFVGEKILKEIYSK